MVLGLVLEAPRGQVFKSLVLVLVGLVLVLVLVLAGEVLVLVLVLLGPVLVLILVLQKRSCLHHCICHSSSQDESPLLHRLLMLAACKP